ncbi:F0F1 ATP synthase subunit B family protein [Methylomarinum vadi]|uniref:F0F1 ATP synthase subunit B family protein n=1 Tax=Methylomarinum vadi TaxID=438855 RepID=UPI0004DF1190|nr:hypothetical protein [Methylomarinum vadi]
MAIDWFTVAAQIVNFLILVWLLKKLLFRPIMNAMERRELGISGRLRQAHEQMGEAEALQQQYQRQLQQLQAEKEAALDQAKQEAEDEKTVLLQQLNEELQRKKAQFDSDIRQQQQELDEQIASALTDKALALSDHILTQLADQTVEQRIIEQFLGHLAALPQTEQSEIKQTLHQHGATLITRFQPDDATKRKLLQWFLDFVPDCSLIFIQRDTLICGIALEAGGRSWEWTIERYLGELETELIKLPGKTI